MLCQQNQSQVTYIDRCELLALVDNNAVVHCSHVQLIEVDVEFANKVGLIRASLRLTGLVPRVVVCPPCTIHD